MDKALLVQIAIVFILTIANCVLIASYWRQKAKEHMKAMDAYAQKCAEEYEVQCKEARKRYFPDDKDSDEDGCNAVH